MPGLVAGAAAACCAAVLAWPPARSVVADHVVTLAGRGATVQSGPGAPGPSMGRAVPPVVIPPASRHAEFLVQLGATMSPGPRVSLERLGVLAGRYPERGSLCAHLLWLAALDGFGPGRHEDGRPPDGLEPFARTAARGERLDPGNAFYPYAAACAHFAAGDDAEGVAALERAATLPRWDDGENERRRARLRSAEAVYGRLSTVQRLAWDERGGQGAPPMILATAMVAARSAARAEEAGRPLDGWRVRRSLIRCGGLMRARACSLSVATAGAAVVWAAVDNPSTADRPRTAAEGIARGADWYSARLAGIGRENEAEWVRREAREAARTYEVRTRAYGQGGPSAGMAVCLLRRPLLRYAWPWMAGLFVLANALWLLSMGIAHSVARPGPGRRWGLAGAGVALGALLTLGAVSSVRGSLVTRCMVVATRPHHWVMPAPTDNELAAAAALSGAIPLALGLAWAVRTSGRRRAGERRAPRGLLIAGIAGVVLYCGLAVVTAAAERDLARDLDHLVAHEGPYLARAVGLPWNSGAR